jgi:hypothetical protein
MRYRHLIAAAACAAAGTLAAGAEARAKSYFNPHALYNCTAPAYPTGFTYIDSYQFVSGRKYEVGYQVNGHLAGHIRSGRYKLRGKRIIPLSGPLKKAHESLLIQQYDLALLDRRGHFTAVGCRNPKYRAPAPSPPASQTMPLGTYQCYETTQELGGGYFTSAPSELTFYDDGTYLRQGRIREAGWHQSGDRIIFTAGSMWQTYAHDQGTWYPSAGVSMPHAQGATAGMTFSLVIRDTQAEGGTPPSVEFSSTDGPGGSSSVPMSFLYCKQ